MDFAVYTQRPVLYGHVLVATPAVGVVALTLFFRQYLFGISPPWPYYLAAAIALGWQWYSAALLRWKSKLSEHGIPELEVDEIARRGWLALPFASIGSLALHTTAAAMCASYLDIWLTGRWFYWMLPLFGVSGQQFAPDGRAYYLQHLVIANSVFPFIVGYIACYKYNRFASWARAVPTTFMAYKLLAFTDPKFSVLINNHWWSGLSYYFGTNVPYSSVFDGHRFFEQVTIVAFFYSGIAYSLGAFAKKRGILSRFAGTLRRDSIIPVRDSELELVSGQPNNSEDSGNSL